MSCLVKAAFPTSWPSSSDGPQLLRSAIGWLYLLVAWGSVLAVVQDRLNGTSLATARIICMNRLQWRSAVWLTCKRPGVPARLSMLTCHDGWLGSHKTSLCRPCGSASKLRLPAWHRPLSRRSPAFEDHENWGNLCEEFLQRARDSVDHTPEFTLLHFVITQQQT